jgi:hypothetical protein
MSRDLVKVLLAGAIVVVAGAACTAEKESCNSSTTCSQSVQTCCTSTQCKYVVAGRTFNCNGTNCDSAAVQAVNAACGRGFDPAAEATSLRGEAALAVQSACRVAP